MKYRISKKKVLQAITTETLTANTFFDSGSVDDGECAVCAVGAVLRNTKRNTFSTRDAIDICGYRYGACQEPLHNNFMSLLSIEFERAYRDKVDELCEIYHNKHGRLTLPSASTYRRYKKKPSKWLGCMLIA